MHYDWREKIKLCHFNMHFFIYINLNIGTIQ